MHDGSWRAATGLVWTRYDDAEDWAVFNPLSGDVHLLTSSAHFLWQTIAARPTSTPDLIAAMASHIGMPPDGELSTAALDTIAFMDRVGLIMPDLQ